MIVTLPRKCTHPAIAIFVTPKRASAAPAVRAPETRKHTIGRQAGRQQWARHRGAPATESRPEAELFRPEGGMAAPRRLLTALFLLLCSPAGYSSSGNRRANQERCGFKVKQTNENPRNVHLWQRVADEFLLRRSWNRVKTVRKICSCRSSGLIADPPHLSGINFCLLIIIVRMKTTLTEVLCSTLLPVCKLRQSVTLMYLFSPAHLRFCATVTSRRQTFFLNVIYKCYFVAYVYVVYLFIYFYFSL